MVAPTGARRMKADHPRLPIFLPEIIQTAIECQKAGADALHLHIRNQDGQHSLDAGRYKEAITELSEALPNLPVQITTEAGGIFGVDEQLDCLRQVKPKWASISVREIDRAPELADTVYGTCADNGTKVQHILYGPDDVVLYRRRRAQGIIRPDQEEVIYVLGGYSVGLISTPKDLIPFLNAGHDVDRWMVCAFGPCEHMCLQDAAWRGGSLRVGFENSVHGEDGSPHESNAASVATLVQRLKNPHD